MLELNFGLRQKKFNNKNLGSWLFADSFTLLEMYKHGNKNEWNSINLGPFCLKNEVVWNAKESWKTKKQVKSWRGVDPHCSIYIPQHPWDCYIEPGIYHRNQPNVGKNWKYTILTIYLGGMGMCRLIPLYPLIPCSPFEQTPRAHLSVQITLPPSPGVGPSPNGVIESETTVRAVKPQTAGCVGGEEFLDVRVAGWKMTIADRRYIGSFMV